MKTAILIPARYASTRFPGKPLHPLAGKPMIWHVWERCTRCERAAAVVIATDDERIRAAAEGFGARVVMTSPDHPSGTDRIAEAAVALPEFDAFLNVQGDEPMIPPTLVDTLIGMLEDDPALPMVTAATPVAGREGFDDPNIVKVVCAADGCALYFSRSPLPFPRQLTEGGPHWLRHKGIYGYRRGFLEKFVTWPPSALEIAEGLEQLRALENGARIRVLVSEDSSPGVDTPDQAEEVERLLLAGA